MSEATSRGGAFRVMRYRNFALYWTGFLVSNAGSWLQSIAQAWLVYDISGSPAWLGAVGFVRSFPLIFLSLIGGTVADRFPKRKILYITQSLQMLSALLLGVLTYLKVVQVWHVIALSALSAVAMAFDNPTRQALVPSLVPKEDLHAAISMNAIAFNGAAVFGPSLAGILVAIIGMHGAFFINAASFGAVFIALALMDFTEIKQGSRKQTMFKDLVEGLRFIGANPVILALIGMAAATSFFARPYLQFLTVFAKDVLHGDVGLAGILQSAPSVGTIIFMLIIASMKDINWKGKMLVVSGIAYAIFLLGFAWSTYLPLSLFLLVLVGGFNMTWQTTVNTLLQANVPDSVRGRVMSAYTITALAFMPLGQGPMGLSVERFGPQVALTIGGSIALLVVVYVALFKVRAVTRLP